MLRERNEECCEQKKVREREGRVDLELHDPSIVEEEEEPCNKDMQCSADPMILSVSPFSPARV